MHGLTPTSERKDFLNEYESQLQAEAEENTIVGLQHDQCEEIDEKFRELSGINEYESQLQAEAEENTIVGLQHDQCEEIDEKFRELSGINEYESQLQAEAEENTIVGLQHDQCEEIDEKFRELSGMGGELSPELYSSTDEENKNNSYLRKNQNRKLRSSLYLTENKERKDRNTNLKKNNFLKNRGHESYNLNKKQYGPRSSYSSRGWQKIEPIYAEIIHQHIRPSIGSLGSEITNSLKDEGLRHEYIQPISELPELLEVNLQTSSEDEALVLTAKSSSDLTSYKPDERRDGSGGIMYNRSSLKMNNLVNLWSKFRAKLGYSIQQRAFITPSVAFITFVASYSVLMPKYYASIQNLIKDPLLFIPIAIASVLFLASIAAFISNLRDTRIKVTGNKDDSKVFKQIKSINNEKCIRSIKLDLSNNTRYTLVDSRKYKTLAFKRLALSLNRPIICAEVSALVTLVSTYLLTKYFEIGYKNLADSLSTFNTSDIELIGFATAMSTILTLFTYSFIHYYRKECVEGLELKKCPRKIGSFNEEYIKEAEYRYNNRSALSSGKHNEGKAASLTIDQAIVEYYDSSAVVIAN